MNVCKLVSRIIYKGHKDCDIRFEEGALPEM